MRVLMINPNTSEKMTEAIGNAARKYAREGTIIDAVSPSFGPRSIEGFFEEYVAAHAMLETLLQRRDSYDAFVIACFGDPGLFGARELVDVPVVGIAEASFHFATLLGYRFSIIVPLPRLEPMMDELARFHGFKDRLASVRTVELPVLEVEAISTVAEERMIAAGRGAVEEDGAEALCLGCAGMALMDKRIEQAVGVPVLDGVVCAVKLVEGMYDYGLGTSKVAAFKSPEPGKEYVGCPPIYDSV